MSIEEIAKRLQSNKPLYPPELAEMRGWLAGQYSFLNSQLIGVLKTKYEEWTKIRYRGDVKSDTAAERLWQRTAAGFHEMELRLQLKSIEKRCRDQEQSKRC